MELSATAATAALRAPVETVRAVVVVPARDEEERIGACLEALVGQVEVGPEEFEIVVVLDACEDDTEAVVEAVRARLGVDGAPAIHIVPGPAGGAGPARATGMDIGCARLESLDRGDGLLASTDADSVVARDWIARQLEALAAGAEAIGGEVHLDPSEAAALPDGVLARREIELAERTRAAATRGPAEHAHFSGASLGVTPRAYRRAGGMAWMAALEDQELEDRLHAAGIAIHRLRPVSVVTAARTEGRAERGLARDLELARWLAERRYDGADFTLERLLAAKATSVAAILPARECAATIAPILAAIAPLRAAGLLDELIVIDADSADGTAAVAREHGATVLSESALRPELGPCNGKGDAMWRAVGATASELVPVGYGVEIAMLIDALGVTGLDGLAEVDLGVRQNRHQSLRALSAMAGEVQVAVERRTGAPPRPAYPAFRPRPEGRTATEVWRLRCEERPPLRMPGADRVPAG